MNQLRLIHNIAVQLITHLSKLQESPRSNLPTILIYSWLRCQSSTARWLYKPQEESGPQDQSFAKWVISLTAGSWINHDWFIVQQSNLSPTYQGCRQIGGHQNIQVETRELSIPFSLSSCISIQNSSARWYREQSQGKCVNIFDSLAKLSSLLTNWFCSTLDKKPNCPVL